MTIAQCKRGRRNAKLDKRYRKRDPEAARRAEAAAMARLKAMQARKKK